jgi:molybdopterin-binding protein
VTLGEPSTATDVNEFQGTVDVLIRGDRRSELQLVIKEGSRLIVTADNTVLDSMQLRRSMQVRCQVDPSNVILAVAA